MSDLKVLRAELGRLNERLADARAREVTAVLARFREEVAALGITEQEVRKALGYDCAGPLPAKYYDPTTGKKWSGKGPRPKCSQARGSKTSRLMRRDRSRGGQVNKLTRQRGTPVRAS
ncbi:H-NS histone family protein [Paraburkholderia sp. SIMBA_009]